MVKQTIKNYNRWSAIKTRSLTYYLNLSSFLTEFTFKHKHKQSTLKKKTLHNQLYLLEL